MLKKNIFSISFKIIKIYYKKKYSQTYSKLLASIMANFIKNIIKIEIIYYQK